jgi:hypothetical protein
MVLKGKIMVLKGKIMVLKNVLEDDGPIDVLKDDGPIDMLKASPSIPDPISPAHTPIVKDNHEGSSYPTQHNPSPNTPPVASSVRA